MATVPNIASEPRAAPAFADATVADAMHVGVVSCAPEATVEDVAQIMATYRVHCVIVGGIAAGEGTTWGIVSDLDLVGGAGSSATAAQVAATEPLTVEPTADLATAARLMTEHETAHLVVIDRDSGAPMGVLSSLDIARALARGGR